jgi:uncharacterized protein DUF6325
MASELRALMGSNTVRVLDLVLLTKDADGSVEASELRDADDSEVGQLRAAEADLAMLLAESDVEEIGGMLAPGSAAAVLVWENRWAAPFGAAVRRSGGQLVTSGRIPTQAILAAMDAGPPPKRKGCDMPLLRDRGDRPGLLGGRDRRGDRRDDPGDQRGDRQDRRRRGPGLFR